MRREQEWVEKTKSCKPLPPAIEDYLMLVESGQWRVCPEQTAMAAYTRKCFAEQGIFVDEEQLGNYLGLEKYFPFELYPWERFLTAIWDCTYWQETKLPRWHTLLAMMGRGAGKDGFIAFDAMCGISPYCEAKRYDVDICANLEEQAKRPLLDLLDVLEKPGQMEKLNRHFYHTKEVIQGKKNKGCMRGRTNNPKSRDGMRSGKIIFNEVHQYENYDNITVFATGLGKTENPRTGYFTSNGTVSDGPLDDLLARGRRILFEEEDDRGLFPFICCLPEKSMVHDSKNWYMANPSLQYSRSLFETTKSQYEDWVANPEQNPDFLTKRMGLRAQAKEIAVTDYDKVLATKKELPDMARWSCTVGIDYAELSDWAAVNIHFRRGAQRYDINHAWLCLQSKTLPRVRAPWKSWADDGHITVVDDVSIHPDLLCEYIMAAAKKYNIKMLALDHHRWTLVSESLKKIGFDANDKTRVKLVRPSDIMQVEPVIQECFDREQFNWGDCPPEAWEWIQEILSTRRLRGRVEKQTPLWRWWPAWW